MEGDILTIPELVELYNSGKLQITNKSWIKCYTSDIAKKENKVSFMPGKELIGIAQNHKKTSANFWTSFWNSIK